MELDAAIWEHVQQYISEWCDKWRSCRQMFGIPVSGTHAHALVQLCD